MHCEQKLKQKYITQINNYNIPTCTLHVNLVLYNVFTNTQIKTTHD